MDAGAMERAAGEPARSDAAGRRGGLGGGFKSYLATLVCHSSSSAIRTGARRPAGALAKRCSAANR
jgi:hypothetical protein